MTETAQCSPSTRPPPCSSPHQPTFGGRGGALGGGGGLRLLVDGQQGIVLYGEVHGNDGLHGQHLGLNLHELLREKHAFGLRCVWGEGGSEGERGPRGEAGLTRTTSCGTAAMVRGRMMITAPADWRRARW